MSIFFAAHCASHNIRFINERSHLSSFKTAHKMRYDYPQGERNNGIQEYNLQALMRSEKRKIDINEGLYFLQKGAKWIEIALGIGGIIVGALGIMGYVPCTQNVAILCLSVGGALVADGLISHSIKLLFTDPYTKEARFLRRREWCFWAHIDNVPRRTWTVFCVREPHGQVRYHKAKGRPDPYDGDGELRHDNELLDANYFMRQLLLDGYTRSVPTWKQKLIYYLA